MTEIPFGPKDLAREFLAIQGGSVEDAIILCEDISDLDLREEVESLIEELAAEDAE